MGEFMKTIVFINEKGGVGKSSLCFNVAWEMSRNKKILVIDFDGQRANLTWFFNVKKSDDMKTIFDVLMKGDSIKSVVRNVKENLDIIPANDLVSDLSTKASVPKFLQALRDIREEYDYCFMDVSPSPNRGQSLALSASDYVIIPMLPEVTALEANNGVMDTIQFIKENLNPKIKVLGFVFNKNVSNNNISRDVQYMAEKMAERLDTSIFETRIKSCVLLNENVGAHIGITEYAKKSNSALEYVQLCSEIEKKIDEENAFDYVTQYYNDLELDRQKMEQKRIERLNAMRDRANNQINNELEEVVNG